MIYISLNPVGYTCSFPNCIIKTLMGWLADDCSMVYQRNRSRALKAHSWNPILVTNVFGKDLKLAHIFVVENLKRRVHSVQLNFIEKWVKRNWWLIPLLFTARCSYNYKRLSRQTLRCYELQHECINCCLSVYCSASVPQDPLLISITFTALLGAANCACINQRRSKLLSTVQ